mgnify:CR=1 FL=1
MRKSKRRWKIKQNKTKRKNISRLNECRWMTIDARFVSFLIFLFLLPTHTTYHFLFFFSFAVCLRNWSKSNHHKNKMMMMIKLTRFSKTVFFLFANENKSSSCVCMMSKVETYSRIRSTSNDFRIENA